MGNRAVISFINISIACAMFATLLPSLAHAGIREVVLQRVCDRHALISERLRYPIPGPKFCKDAPIPQVPTVELTASPTTIDEGATSTLAWVSTHADSCSASGGTFTGTKDPDGTQSVSPIATTTYAIICTGTGGSASDSVTVSVVPTPEPEPVAPTLSFTASRLTVHGESSADATTTLSWDSTDADSCTASGAPEWNGSKSVDGEETVTPVNDVVYGLDCTGAGGSVHKEVTIDFIPAPEPEPVIGHVVVSEVQYDVASTTVSGNDSSFEWVELFNGTSASVDLQGWFIGDASSTDMITQSVVVPAGTFAVIVASTTPAGIPAGVPVIVLHSSIGQNGFANTGEGVVLNDAASALVDQVGYGDSSTFTPIVSIPSSHDGHSIHRVQLTSDTDTAADWADTDAPSPGQ